MARSTWNPRLAWFSAALMLALSPLAAQSHDKVPESSVAGLAATKKTEGLAGEGERSLILSDSTPYYSGQPGSVESAKSINSLQQPDSAPAEMPAEADAARQTESFGQPGMLGEPYNAFAVPQEFSTHPYQAPAGGFQTNYERYEAPQYSFEKPSRGWLYPAAQAPVTTIPSGLILPISLDTSISTSAARPGDYIQAHISQNISLGGPAYLPGGTVVTGTVTDSKPGRWAERSGSLTVSFTQLRLPTGLIIPISAHLVGGIANYKNHGNDTFRGEGIGTKLLNLGLRTSASAGMGAVLGMGIGAISDGGRGLGSGCWSGMAMGAGVGALESLVWRRGRDVLVHAGTHMQLQLEDPVEIPGPGRAAGPGYPQQGVL